MAESNPDIQLADAVDDEGEELLDALADFDEHSEISSVVRTASHVERAEWTLAVSDDEEAPQVTCTLSAPDEASESLPPGASRSVGHGLRPVVAPDSAQVPDGPKVVVRFEI